MGQSVSYHYWSKSNKVRLEVIQVDNGASHINVSANFQLNAFDGADGYQADPDAFDGFIWSGYLRPNGEQVIGVNGTNGSYPGSGWRSIVTKWIGTIPRSAGTFVISWSTIWQDTYETNHLCAFDTPAITIFPYTPPDSADTLSNYSALTLGTSVTFTLTNSTSYSHSDTLTYQIGSATGTIGTKTVAAGGTNTITWTPPASLGAQIPAAWTGTMTITLTTSGVGSNSYSAQVTVPTYTYTLTTPTVAKATYAAIGSSSQYVAGKHTVRWTMPAFPSAQYGATISGTFYVITGGNIVYQQNVSGGDTVDYTASAAGTYTGTLRITDSRGVMAQQTRSVTYIANPGVSVTFSAQRSGATTTVNLAATGTYSSAITGLAATLDVSKNGVSVQSAAGAGGSASLTTTDTLPLASSQVYVATMTDTLDNTAVKTITVPIAFFYLQVGGGANGKGVSIGRAASTTGTDTLEIGLPTTIDEETRVKYYFPWMQTDADGNTMLSAYEYFMPRITRSMIGLTTNDIKLGLGGYLKWLAKNVPNVNSRIRGLFTCGNMYAVDVMIYQKNVNSEGMPQYTAGIAYTYGASNNLLRFGTYNYTLAVYKMTETEI